MPPCRGRRASGKLLFLLKREPFGKAPLRIQRTSRNEIERFSFSQGVVAGIKHDCAKDGAGLYRADQQ